MLFRVLELVPTLACDLFGEIGVHVGKRTKARYLTEVVFEDFEHDRPDGFIAIKNWKALIEAKCDSNNLCSDQVGRYVEVAKHHKLDAVITISNEMVARPTHHPCYKLSKSEERKLSLYHLSWQLIFTRICLWVEREEALDHEQLELLTDFRDFLKEKTSGLQRFDRMSPSWKLLLQDIRKLAKSERLPSTNQHIRPVVRDWFLEERDLALKLSEQLKAPIKLHIPRKFVDGNKSEERLESTAKELLQNLHLETHFIIPNAADVLCIRADLIQRKIEVSMKLRATQDSSSTRGRIGWLKRMLRDVDDDYLDMTLVTLRWSGKSGPEVFSVREIFQWRKMPAHFPSSPVASFEIRMQSGESNAFQSPSKFILEVEHLTSLYYWQVGERLKRWVPKPPKLDHVIEPHAPAGNRY